MNPSRARDRNGEIIKKVEHSGLVTAVTLTDRSSLKSLCWDQLLDNPRDGIALVDESGVICFANSRLAEMAGVKLGLLTDMPIEELMPTRFRTSRVLHREQFGAESCARRMGWYSDLTLRRLDGSELDVVIDLVPVIIQGKTLSVLLFRDDTSLRTADQVRRDDELRFRMVFDESLAPMVITDLEDRAIAVNDAFCEMVGFSRQEILDHDSSSFTHPEDLDISETSRSGTNFEIFPQARYVKRYVRKDGRVIVVEVSRAPARNSAGGIMYFVISERDITEATQRNRLLNLLVSVSRLASHAVDESSFLQDLCDTVVSEGGYALAWFAVESPDGGIEILCAAGATGYLEGQMRDWLSSCVSAQGPTATSIRTGTRQVANDMARQNDMTVWGNCAKEFEIGSLVAIPHQIGSQRTALVVYHRDLFAFDDITVSGLEEIVNDAQLAVLQLRSNQKIADGLADAMRANEELRRSRTNLSASEQRFRLAFESNMAPMIFSNQDDLAIAANDAFCEMLGYSREEILGHDSEEFTHPADVELTKWEHQRLVTGAITQVRYVKRYFTKDRRVIIVEVSRSSARDENGKTLYYFSSERDITEARSLTEELSHHALHHPLTGLANRALFENRLSRACARVVRDGEWAAIVMINLDNFSGVNETLRHVAGDSLLVEVAVRLESVTRSTDTLCHMGGDEFLYLAEGLTCEGEVEVVVNRLLVVFATPFRVAGRDLEQNASMGVVTWDSHSSDDANLIQNANAALQEAKTVNRGGFILFESRMHARESDSFVLAQEIREALLEGHITMHYQPIVELATKSIVGFESLMRWSHPQRGDIPPDVFLPIAEQSHVIIDLSDLALREAITTANTWGPTNEEGNLPYVTVNLSVRQFYHHDLVRVIKDCLSTSGLAPNRLILEITEGAALQDVWVALELLERLRAIGVGIALDDFGTGYSSLSYLSLLRPHIIKIDKSFLNPTEQSEQSDLLLEAIVSLGTKLQITMLAEGIETTRQLERLIDLRCHLGQGYLFSPAVPPNETFSLIRRSLEKKLGTLSM